MNFGEQQSQKKNNTKFDIAAVTERYSFLPLLKEKSFSLKLTLIEKREITQNRSGERKREIKSARLVGQN